jgi:NAD+ synthase (glutamine-hydrolysing)
MQKKIHLGTAAINTTPKDWETNTKLIIESIQEAKEKGVKLLCLPELTITGYGCEDEFHAPYVSEMAVRILFDKIQIQTAHIAVAIGLPLQLNGATYNTIALVANGKVRGFVAKQNLAGDGIHYEPRFFKAWTKGYTTTFKYQNTEYPIGDLLFNLKGIKVGFEICEDAWVAERPGIELAKNAVDVILNPSASHFSIGKAQTRNLFVQEGSRAFHCAYVYANLLGNEAGRAIYDGDTMIANEGQIITRSTPFSYAPYHLTDAVVDIGNNQVSRNRQASFKPAIETKTTEIKVNFEILNISNDAALTKITYKPTETNRFTEFEEAAALGLFDYMRKSWTNGFAISLSGGADSSACLLLVYLMAKKLVNYPEHPIFERLGLQNCTANELMAKICVCAYQGTDNSSKETLDAATTLANATGARFQNINVKPLVDQYEAILAQFLERGLDWEQDDIARQNIQARCRAPGIWAIANTCNFLLLSTSNRSEAAVGYCTMDGDTAGSISPIAGMDKEFIREWLQVSEQHLYALKKVNHLVPTAELRPLEADQTDEEDLMPYKILNKIQKFAVIQKKSPEDIFYLLKSELQDVAMTDSLVFQWIERYFTLWSRNQWKRERYAPSFHLDDENLDPRSWCRYPILSGGYQKELKTLKKKLNL